VSGYSVFLYVGATTLAAVIVTLCAFKITATRMDRQKSRRSHMLEGPVPGRQSLSSIGLNNQSTRSALSSCHQGQRAAPPSRTSTHNDQRPGPPTSGTSRLQPKTETRLNSLQTIRARSAALQSDVEPGKLADPKPLMPVYAPSTQRPGTRPLPLGGQGTPPTRATGIPAQPGNTDRTSSHAGPAAASAGPAIAQETPLSKRAKRANPQAEIPQSRSDQPPADALPNVVDLQMLDALQPSPAGDSLLPPPSQEDGMLDILAGLDEADGIHDLTQDLDDIDGGGLPGAGQRSLQKSRR
jgi:hypothetical protein